MGTLHYGIVQQQNDANKTHWHTIATFEFGKDYELFRFLHDQKPSKVPHWICPVEDRSSLGEPYDDMYHYQVFTEEDLFVDGQLMAVFRYSDIEDDELKGQPAFIYEAMIATFVLVPGNKRIVICQDQ